MGGRASLPGLQAEPYLHGQAGRCHSTLAWSQTPQLAHVTKYTKKYVNALGIIAIMLCHQSIGACGWQESIPRVWIKNAP